MYNSVYIFDYVLGFVSIFGQYFLCFRFLHFPFLSQYFRMMNLSSQAPWILEEY